MSLLDMLYPAFGPCLVCGKEDKNSLTIGFCGNCALPFTGDNNAVFYYEEPIKTQIHLLKYHNKRYLAKIFAPMIRKKLSGKNFDVITFVPMTEKKQRERGYNQVELLAREVDGNVKPLLKQVRETTSQTELTGEKRRLNKRGAYAAIGDLSGLSVLLLDDVMTTGATMGECKNALLQAGAKTVDCFSLAVTK